MEMAVILISLAASGLTIFALGYALGARAGARKMALFYEDLQAQLYLRRHPKPKQSIES